MSLFGSTPSATSTPSKPLFGSGSSLFGATQSIATPPASGSLFGAAPAAQSTPLLGAKPATTGLFGAAPTATTTAAPATGGLFGATAATPATGGLFGAPATTTAASGGLFGANATTTTAAPAPTVGLFGATTTTTAAPTATTGLFGATTTAPKPATSGLFGAAPAATTTTTGLFGAKPATTTPSSTLGLGLGVTPAPANTGSLTLGTSATPAAAIGTSTAPGSGMSFAEFNALLQQLTNEFEDLNHQFVEDVSVLNNYDQLLRDNSKTLLALNDEIAKLEQGKSRCATESDAINAQLKDITEIVLGLEKNLGISNTDLNLADYAKNSDANRQHIMKMFLSADAVMQHLEEDVDNLKQQVDALGKLSTVDGTTENAESFEDVRQILVNQMEQLVFVDKQSEELGHKLNEVRGKI